jgi:hypothetical protein
MEENRILDLVLVKYGHFLVNCGHILVKCGRILEIFGIDVQGLTFVGKTFDSESSSSSGEIRRAA